MSIGNLTYRLTPDSLIVGSHTIVRGKQPSALPTSPGKWNWLRIAILQSPDNEWMSYEFDNKQEAKRCQGSINNKYTKDLLYAKGRDTRTKLQPSNPGLDNGNWTVFWMVQEKTD